MKNPNPSDPIFRTIGRLAVTLGVVTAVACGGSVDAGGSKNGVNAVDAGGADGGGAADGIDPAQACDDYSTKVVQPCHLEGVSAALAASDKA